MSVLDKLTEGIVARDLKKEGTALLSKWEKTGLLEGLDNDVTRQGMARLLENQASQLLKEASTMAGGDVEGFASVAFPLVRRVFGGLLANDVVSVQPMSLPSGLIFFLDFTHNRQRSGVDAGESVYGGGVVGQEITGGVNLGYEGSKSINAAGTITDADIDVGFYNLSTGYSSPTGSVTIGEADIDAYAPGGGTGTALIDLNAPSENAKKVLRYDPDVLGLGDGHSAYIISTELSKFENLSSSGMFLNKRNLIAVSGTLSNGETIIEAGSATQVRRLTALGSEDHHPAESSWDGTETRIYLVYVGVDAAFGSTVVGDAGTAVSADLTIHFPLADNFAGDPAGRASVDHVGVVAAASEWGLEDEAFIPEIDIKVDSIAVTAVTKKLKAKWTPELGQDLNAYHNLDAEVELTSILSEQIALEIDREILNDLIQGATAGTLYWSRSPGLFVNRETGAEIGASSAAPDFTGTVSEWYETLIETINDVSARIHRKTLRGGANFVICSPEVASILEFTAGFRASVTVDADAGSIGAVKTGSLSKKFDVYVDPYFPRNVILVGRKGGSFLESGYVYAPYVPLQVTPTIFGVEDFVPRKGVMTRYAKKMVRPDMYGLVICRGLVGEAGAS
tara:strand:- start:6309 stop:8174 length:1866 start_codon:yes stop_codon:yes gene_type:complete